MFSPVKWRDYIVLTIVSVALFAAAAFLPVSDIVSATIATPGAVVLLAALYQWLREHWRLEHERHLRTEDRAHALATSHMACVAFDKYAKFCEQYIEKFFEILPLMIAKGPNKEWSDHAEALIAVRRQFIVWVPSDVAEPLDELERSIWMVGITQEFLKDLERGEQRTKFVREIHETFRRLHTSTEDKPSFRELVNQIKELLGVDELSTMRKAVVKHAAKTLGD